jgi:ParB family chromosome partitioning protein
MADWWEPTAEGYLNHVPKAQIVAALKEAGPDLAGGGVEAMKKDALVTQRHRGWPARAGCRNRCGDHHPDRNARAV